MSEYLAQRLANHLAQVRTILQYQLGDKTLSRKRFIIFGRGRSGSTALVSLLNGVPGMNCEGEILNQRVLFPQTHVEAQCRNARADIYGCKILSYQLRDVQPILDKTNFIRRLNNKGFRIIYLKRENLLYHALSNIRARAFGFHSKKTEQRRHGKIEIDLDDLLGWIQKSEALDDYEKLLLEDVPHLPITYEQHLLNPEEHQATADLVCEYLGIAGGHAETNYQKVSPKKLQDSVSNHSEMVEFLKGTPYGRYLDD